MMRLNPLHKAGRNGSCERAKLTHHVHLVIVASTVRNLSPGYRTR